MFEPRLTILPTAQRALWDHLIKHAFFLQEHGYYLAGGTALALHIGHRQSVDFDFFSQQPHLGEITRAWLEKTTPPHIIRDTDEDTIHIEIENVKISFLSNYQYPLISPMVESNGIQLASIMDIGLMKLLSITHRATVRDYIDLAAIIQDHIPLSDLVATSVKKYGDGFNPMLSLRALVTFTDIEQEMPVMLNPTLIKSWQKILRDAVKNLK